MMHIHPPQFNYIFPKEYAGQKHNSWVNALYTEKLNRKKAFKIKKLPMEGQSV